MKAYPVILFLLLIISGCSSPNQKDTAKTAAVKTADSVSRDSTTIPDSSGTARKPLDSAALDLEIANESTLSPSKGGLTFPPYGLDKVQAAILKMRHTNSDSDMPTFKIAVKDSVYNSWSFDEKFTYNMIHAEDYSQMCSMLPFRTDDDKRIYGRLVDLFGEYHWSERQYAFFKDNRDSVVQLMKAVIEKDGTVGMNFLTIIVADNVKELIPYLITVNRIDPTNHSVLTTLMLLMEINKYPGFINSVSANKLYKKKEDTYSAYINYNKANEHLIIQRATDFYNGDAKQ